MIDQSYLTLGQEISTVPVQLSYRIIELFSEGLYSSPNKAVEELVSNAFDAGASNVHVVLSPDLTSEDATIIVADDGISMNEKGLRKHWLIGVSDKRNLARVKRTKLPEKRCSQ